MKPGATTSAWLSGAPCYDFLFHAMTLNRNHFIAAPQREALVSLTALFYIEEHQLLTRPQLEDAKKSLQALFLRTSGEETTLRQLIEVLTSTRNIHRSFASISGIINGVRKCADTIGERIAMLRADIERLTPTAEERRDFIDPFLSFSQRFQTLTGTFATEMQQLVQLKEEEARAQSIYRIALDARTQLKQRLSGTLGETAGGEVEARIRNEIVQSFDYGEAQAALKAAAREAQHKERDVGESLKAIQEMCRMAMNPAMRDKAPVTREQDDIFVRFTQALPTYPRLDAVREPVRELFKLYQHAHGMFALDLTKLSQAMETMTHNAEAYFEAKEEDRDLAAKRERLRRIEGLIPFLEYGARLTREEDADTYYKFSRQLSGAISQRKSPWAHIAEDLLRTKIQAEAELSTRL